MYKTLWEMPAKAVAEIDRLTSDLSPALFNRMTEMGFYGGQMIKCVKHCPFNGPQVVQLGDSVFSLDKQMAKSVTIKRQDSHFVN